jgi:hypothetical protein
MNRKSARKTSKDAATKIEALTTQVEQLVTAKESLLDIINLIVLDAGGRVEVPLTVIEGHHRRKVTVDVIRPDPETAGDTGHYVIMLEGYKPEEEVKAVAKRMKDLGIWIPGQEGQA